MNRPASSTTSTETGAPLIPAPRGPVDLTVDEVLGLRPAPGSSRVDVPADGFLFSPRLRVPVATGGVVFRTGS
ncbi:MAG: hypothetical protein JWP64_3990 [Pseudonocardia sp.]|jgi:hypothetical protein|uniref:hypothetical protein n=1 Tax=Pseudonocardia sp. TaxID=60912 RepID=UPI002628DB7F|nr:hypothetical protein [Pseudonocardia sp.]MCU1629041.1 hypothetical protein [Pseudonocardia sp.]HEV7469868.1 hypothetical protein [Pseudonocardia sp.]